MNLRDVLRSLSIPWKENGQSPLVTGGWVGLKCNRCDGGKNKPGLGIHVRSLRCSCWRCGSVGIVEALSEASGKPKHEIAALLGGLAPDRGPVQEVSGKYTPPLEIGDLLPAHRKYLIARGFDPDELYAKWGVRGIGRDGGKYAWRVFIPVKNEFGEAVSWTTRAIGDVPHNDRYRGAKREESKIPRGDCLGGAEHARSSVIVCEGFFSAARVGPGAVWTAGVGYSRGQILRLSKYARRAILFDSDPAAQIRARKLADQLACFDGETVIATIDAADPAEASDEEVETLRERFIL